MTGGTAVVAVGAGISGFTGVFVILSALSRLPAPRSVDFALAFVAETVPSLDEATVGSGFSSGPAEGSFFVAGVLAAFGVSFAGGDGTIAAILYFSNGQLSLWVLTLNMLSSYATITP